MSPTLIYVLLFLIVFALVVLAVNLGSQFLESQKKKKVTEMLQTASGAAVQTQAKVLMEPETPANVVLMRFLNKFNFVRKLDSALQQAGLTMSVYSLLVAMLILAVPGAIIGARMNFMMYVWLSALAGGLAMGMLPYAYVMHARKKRMSAFEEQFPETLDFLARAMRAGHAFSISLEMLSEESPPPTGQEFRKVFNEQNLGLPIEVALANLSSRVPLLDVSFFVSAVLLQRETGGNLAEILNKLALIIRERFKLKGAVRAASAHGRITGTILTLMPVALMFGLLVVAPGYLQGMAKDPDGRKLIAACLVAMVIGHFTIKKIVNIKV
jgi:tight adherence protein B